MFNVYDTKIKLFSSLAVFCFVFLIGYLLIVYPLYKKTRLIKQESRSASSSQLKRKLLLKQMKIVRQENAGLRTEYRSEKTKLGRQYSYQDILRNITNIAANAGLSLVTLEKPAVLLENSMKIISCSYVFVGSFARIVDFITRLYKLDYFFAICNFSLTKQTNGDLELKIRLRVYQNRLE